MAEENTQEQTTEQVEQNTEEMNTPIEEQTTNESANGITPEVIIVDELPTEKSSDESKAKKKSSKTIGYTAAYIGKGGHPQVLPGSFKRKKDAERALRRSGVDSKNMRVQAIKE